MSLQQRCFLTVCVLSIAVTFQACKTTTTERPVATGGLQVQITATPNNSCLQNGIMGGKAAIGSDGVTWQGPTATSAITVTLTTCPFAANCSFSSPAGGGSVSSGAASGSSGTTYSYSSITIGGNQCTLNGDGLIMK